MKKLIAILFIAAALTAQAQTTFTNGVKFSQLPSASTPLAGTEGVSVYQSGNFRISTVAQIIAAAISQDNDTSNSLANALFNESTNRIFDSNALASTISAIYNSDSANFTSMNTLRVNDLAAQSATNSLFSAGLAAAYLKSNPSNYQSAAQVSATAAGAAAAAVSTYSSAGVTNGGTANLGNLNYVPVFATIPGSSYTVDLTLASVQVLDWTNPSAMTIYATNFEPGQSVTIIVKNDSGSQRNLNVPAVGYNYGNNTLSPHVNGAAFMTILSVDTNAADAQLNSQAK